MASPPSRCGGDAEPLTYTKDEAFAYVKDKAAVLGDSATCSHSQNGHSVPLGVASRQERVGPVSAKEASDDKWMDSPRCLRWPLPGGAD